ncbi:indole-3-glycerol phosphate synthase TrpC [Desulfatitalea tepidiphila]|uniref:indole-3-glycerol phosphate synthase TrpC n=1 Tax=Desulfatitalea tepidiphila TaxID=1185843 RepID=UPI000ADA8109|nr:indole-3-glycerol phosphate synthase TrpC [Desulfatitalea tepidiphila]
MDDGVGSLGGKETGKMTLLDRIVADKKAEVAAAANNVPEHGLRSMIDDRPWQSRGFERRLCGPGPGGVNIIAEVKRASPSKGDICVDLDAVECARQYETGGAAAVSVLTDAPYFKGCLEDLRRVREAVGLPVLRKEFIIDPYQLYESRAAGADAVLLIARILSPAQLKELLALTHELGMDALVEIHSAEDYAAAHDAGSRLIGINNRNLANFDTDLRTALGLKALLQPNEVPVAASGIHGREDILRNLEGGIFNFLIGESLVRAKDRVAMLRSLTGKVKD